MHSQSTLIIGGARSGKSSYGEKLALEAHLTPIYIATAEARDDEMQVRIKHHKQQRSDAGWHTVEEPINLADTIDKYASPNSVIFIDCLTLWLNNLMADEDANISKQIEKLVDSLEKAPCPIILISNEVGMGIVPMHKLARDFRDEAGRLNQRLAALVPNCYFIIAGLPLPLKRNGRTLVESVPQ